MYILLLGFLFLGVFFRRLWYFNFIRKYIRKLFYNILDCFWRFRYIGKDVYKDSFMLVIIILNVKIMFL